MLGSQGVVQSIEVDRESVDLPFKLSIACQAEPVCAKHIIANADYLPPDLVTSETSASEADARTTAHVIAVLPSIPKSLRRGPSPAAAGEEGSVQETEQDDTAVVVFPPEDGRGLVRALLMGDGTGSCPSGQCESLASPQLTSVNACRRAVPLGRVLARDRSGIFPPAVPRPPTPLALIHCKLSLAHTSQ